MTTVASENTPSGKLQIRIDGATLLATLDYAANPSIESRYYQLPKVLEAIKRGDYAALDEYFGLEETDSLFIPENATSELPYAYGHNLAHICGDLGKNRPTPTESIEMIHREPALMGFSAVTFCAWWGEDGDVPPSINTDPASDVPALAVFGQLDSCCGIRWSQPLALAMPNLQRVELQAQGHVGTGADCVQELVSAFLDVPSRRVNDSCKNEVQLRPWVFYGD
ncbi:alpha/beta hydrolase [Mesorhizobium sp. M2A.F.Ca.ET.037.01.1.1]|uniref:alpha/beta hydrolase n=1 Tax=Mesorhizobium sp. M2A.F.Ca.ET.037.01.1.1 TaxID=2496748 RepID=UPI0016768411|nr:alpha/beta hydrolase [Mesorhizobium sp. M2A.F.Ca.ET.037.01.1.1]